MTPESIVVSLEHAKALKKAGWPQAAGMIVWHIHQPERKTDEESFSFHWRSSLNLENLWDWFAAPTAEEILRRLPHAKKDSEDQRIERDLHTLKETDGSWTVFFVGDDSQVFNDPSLANAAAAMFVFLKENNLLPHDPL